MSNIKLFGTAFSIAFLLTAGLCFFAQQPLIFDPINYSAGELLKFGLLIGFLCFCLVYINLSALKYIRRFLFSNSGEFPFYLIGTFIILQIVTLSIGYLESDLTTSTGDPFYYYKGVGNSLIYVFTGNLTSILISCLYVKKQIDNREKQAKGFDFETEKSDKLKT